ncbi:MAG: SDR family NAD(P)-dependent oxidoreductase [Boseongicola sp.]|nr:SDR family NAD(P)-dependent oxidoreductase [Boseongicola sp.]
MSDSRKSILITGCSSGIGHDAAHGLVQRGWRVFATCRKAEDCDRLRAEGLESFRLDYEDEDSIGAALDETLVRTGGTLDAVFNNGAYGIPGLLEDMPRDALRAIFETNFFGQHDLTRRVIPVMRAQGHGRILMNSSILGFAALKWRGAYNSTKFAMEGWSDTLRMELHSSNIRVILIEPGPITSDIRRKSIPHFEKWIDWQNSARAEHYETRLKPRLYQTSDKPDRFELPASAVTDAVHDALTHANPRLRYRITTPTKVVGVLKRILSTRMLDRILARI